MGDIADMHVEAFQSGLDPNDMDGSDWADFYEEESPADAETLIAMISSDCRLLLCWIDDLRAIDAAEFDATTSERAKALRQHIPEFQEAETIIDLLAALNIAALAAEDKLNREGDASK